MANLILSRYCGRLLVFFFFILMPSFLAAADDTQVLATVNGAPIILEQVNAAAQKYIPQAYYHRQVSEERLKEFRDKALKDVIDEELEYQEAKRVGVKIAKSDIKANIDMTRKEYVSKKAFELALQKAGLTIEMLEAKVERGLLINKIYEREIVSKVNAVITEGYLLDYYKKGATKFKEPEKIRLRHILIAPDASKGDAGWPEAKKAVDDILKQIKSGADFGDMAWKHSKDDYRVKGGDIGFIHRGRLLPEIEDAAFGLKVGEVSAPIKSEYGYHIVKLEEKKQEVQLEFNEVKDKIKTELEKKLINDMKDNWLKGLREKAKIEIISSKK